MDAVFRIFAHGSVTGEGTAGLAVSVGPGAGGAARLVIYSTQHATQIPENYGYDGSSWTNPAGGLWETRMPLLTGTTSFYIQMVASASASNGGVADFGNTFGFDIVLPTGATMTSESGVFLTQNDTPAPVPLPPALPLMAGAVAGLGLWRRLGKSHGVERPA